MKKIVTLLLVFCVGFTYAQDKKNPKVEKKGDLTFVTYYHENGKIEQTGLFNEEGKLHGEWTSYDLEGNKVTVGTYDTGRKVGKWFFWEGDSLKEVDYIDSKIVSVNKWNNKTKVAIRNK
jgi:antitoxin component YwqK of YwqJK toxin-antitoxin module